MPEYRQDPLTGRTVIIAEERAARPHQFDIEDAGQEDADSGRGYRPTCPFCEGNEGQTTREIMAFRQSDTLPDAPGWQVRAIPNKYPAVARDDAAFHDLAAFQDRFSSAVFGAFSVAATQCAPQSTAQGGYLFDMKLPGVGHHEVIVDTPRHVLSVTDLTEREVRDMFLMYRERLRSLKAEGRWACVEIFKNVGAAAGASIPHSHSQLVAMPFVPPGFLTVLYRAKQYQSQAPPTRSGHGCFYCDRLQFELREKTRIIEETNDFVALCPFVSRFSCEVEIYPKAHMPGFEAMNDNALVAQFAVLVRRTIARLEQASSGMKGGPLAYNYVLQTQPFDRADRDDESAFHWHLSILPSLARAAGFEWGTGLHINPIPPEKAAEKLRSVNVASQ